MKQRFIAEVVNLHTEWLLSIPGVTVVRAGERHDGTSYIRVGVDGWQPTHDELIPKVLDGFPVELEEVDDDGELRGQIQ